MGGKEVKQESSRNLATLIATAVGGGGGKTKGMALTQRCRLRVTTAPARERGIGYLRAIRDVDGVAKGEEDRCSCREEELDSTGGGREPAAGQRIRNRQKRDDEGGEGAPTVPWSRRGSRLSRRRHSWGGETRDRPLRRHRGRPRISPGVGERWKRAGNTQKHTGAHRC